MEVSGGGVTLPEEIIFDVLSWLPVKSLIRFRRVSKGWRALISDPVFIATHKSRAAPLLVCSFAACELRVMDTDGNVLRVLKDVAGPALTATRLDLVCVDEGWNGARVIDPATGRVVTIWRSAARLGQAAPSGDYKVFCFLDHACLVATLEKGIETGTWRERQRLPIRICPCDGCTVAINGVIYVLPDGVHEQRGLWNRIARFNLESENWKAMIDGPPEVRRRKTGQRMLIAIGELKSTLTMVETIQSPYTSAYIWLLVDAERSVWVKGYTVQSVNMLYLVKPLEVLCDGRLLLLKTFEKQRVSTDKKGAVLQLYDSNTGTCTDVMDMPKEFAGGITLYTGSLLS